MAARIRHIWLVLTRFPVIALHPEKRALFFEARSFLKSLPDRLKRPLPDMMEALTPSQLPDPPETDFENSLRETADVAALLDRRSPLGLCLRRSLLRYYVLRRAGVPVEIRFGARFKEDLPDRKVTGHAWTTLSGKPYYEDGENWRGFTVMLVYPDRAP